MKVSEFLEKHTESHGIFSEPELSNDFKKKTGHEAPWPKHTVGRTNVSMEELKGLTFEIQGNESNLCSYGYEIAEFCESKFAGTSEYRGFRGRGRSYRASVEALKEAQK